MISNDKDFIKYTDGKIKEFKKQHINYEYDNLGEYELIILEYISKNLKSWYDEYKRSKKLKNILNNEN